MSNYVVACGRPKQNYMEEKSRVDDVHFSEQNSQHAII